MWYYIIKHHVVLVILHKCDLKKYLAKPKAEWHNYCLPIVLQRRPCPSPLLKYPIHMDPLTRVKPGLCQLTQVRRCETGSRGVNKKWQCRKRTKNDDEVQALCGLTLQFRGNYWAWYGTRQFLTRSQMNRRERATSTTQSSVGRSWSS